MNASGRSLLDPAGLWRRVFHPLRGFRELAQEPPGLGRALARMMALRTPVALLAWSIAAAKLSFGYAAFRAMDGLVWKLALPRLAQLNPELRPEDLKAFLDQLPQLPSLGTLLAWGLLVAPLAVLSLWLHDAVWDHGCLWLLGGLKTRKGLRTSMVADAEALAVGVVGALAALLGDIPVAGLLLSLPLAILGMYFWVLRGFALAAFHDVPPWKGVAATLLHLVLAGCCLMGSLALLVFVVLLQAG